MNFEDSFHLCRIRFKPQLYDRSKRIELEWSFSTPDDHSPASPSSSERVVRDPDRDVSRQWVKKGGRNFTLTRMGRWTVFPLPVHVSPKFSTHETRGALRSRLHTDGHIHCPFYGPPKGNFFDSTYYRLYGSDM